MNIVPPDSMRSVRLHSANTRQGDYLLFKHFNKGNLELGQLKLTSGLVLAKGESKDRRELEGGEGVEPRCVGILFRINVA